MPFRPLLGNNGFRYGFNPVVVDGVMYVLGKNNNLVALDAVTGKEITALRGHEDWVLSAAFSPDGSRIVTASRDNTARIGDAITGKEIRVLHGHTDWVMSAAFRSL